MPTDEQLKRLAARALDVAAAAPERQTNHVHAANIPWTLIHDIRRELEAAGIDWRAFKRENT